MVGDGDSKEEAIQDHDAKLQQLLNRFREQNIKLNSNKMKLRRSEVPYTGHLLTLAGLGSDPGNLRAFEEMQFVGMSSSFPTFCAYLSEVCKPLR